MTIQIGRLGQAYAKVESSYGTAPTFASTDAIRHLDLSLDVNVRNRENSPERLTTPDVRTRFTRRTTAKFDLKKALMYPSGTLGTAPELKLFYTHGIGAQRAITPLATTINDPAATTTSGIFTAVTGLAVNDPILLVVSGVKYVRWITAIASLTVTWAPALPGAPADTSAVKSGVSYSPATNPASSIDIGHYLTTNGSSFSRELLGCVMDKLSFMFDANKEPMFSASGPAKSQTRPAQTQPGAFTTVGTVIPSGLTGELRVGSAAYTILKFQADIQNNMTVRNEDFGTSAANGFYRRGRRVVDISLDARVEDAAVIYANAESTTTLALLLQCGFTEGSIVAMYFPKVEFEIPSTPDPEEELTWTFKGVAMGTSGNDECFLGFL